MYIRNLIIRIGESHGFREINPVVLNTLNAYKLLFWNIPNNTPENMAIKNK